MPGGIPDWDYERFPSDALREQRCRDILIDLDAGRISALGEGTNPRPIHLRMFNGMTHPGEEYFAGHYRGENFPLLLNYGVQVGQDARVGVPPQLVANDMARFAGYVAASVGQLSPLRGNLDPKSLVFAVGEACALLVEFLRIHPFANGNGHIGRFIVWAVLNVAGIRPRSWPLNSKLPAPYGALLSRYRDGDRLPLMQFVLSHI